MKLSDGPLRLLLTLQINEDVVVLAGQQPRVFMRGDMLADCDSALRQSWAVNTVEKGLQTR